MSDEKPKKPDNIVKKVFERTGSKSDKVSALFTHYKNPKAKKEMEKAAKAPSKLVKKEAPNRKTPAAFDIGTSSIKLFQLARDGKGGYEAALMDEEALDFAQTTLSNQSKSALQKLTARNSVGNNVIVGIPARETLTYNFTFPAMTEDELQEAVKWKLKQLKPFDQEIENIKYTLLKWDAFPQGANSSQLRVTVVCVTAEKLLQKNALLSEVGLKAVSVMISPLTLVQARNFGRAASASNELVLWLDLGFDETVFVLEKNGIPLYIRNLSITGKALTRQVAQVCHLADMEAEAYKKKYGLESWTPSLQSILVSEDEKNANPSLAVCLALFSALENLVVDIEHSFKHFSYQVTQSQVTKFDRVMLTGGGASLIKVDQFLSDRLGVPVGKTGMSSVFASATGLALAHVNDKSRSYDLLSNYKKSSSNSFIDKLLNQPKFAAIVGVILMAILVLPQMAALAYYKKEAESLNLQVKQTRGDINKRQTSQLELAEQEKKLLEKKTALQEKLSLFKDSGRDEKDFSKLLTKLASLLPEEVWVTKLSYVDKKLTLVGATARNDLIIQFLENLKKPSEFSEVVFNYTQRDAAASIYNFEVMMNVK